MSGDRETLSVYADKAREYADLTSDRNPYLNRFLALLPPGSAVLDLGCGTGHDAGAMRDAGLVVEAWDAAPQFAEVARELHGIDVRVATFGDLTAHAQYDGIWASFSLLHAPRADFPDHIKAIHRALKPGGVFHIGMKTGSGEQRDALGRRYAYFTPDEIGDHLGAAGFTQLFSETGEDIGLDGTIAPWVVIHAHG